MTDHAGDRLSLQQQRQQTITRLCEHFAQDRLTMEELERRIDVAERSHDGAELAALLQDLQAGAVLPTAERAPAPSRPGTPLPLLERGTNTAIVALLGGAVRRGHWRPAEHNFVLAVMGGAELDFREVSLPAGETEVFILALMGGAEIIVPPDLQVEVNGIGIMGGFDHYSSPPTAPDAPRLKVHGLAMMGGVSLEVRLPGETAGDARSRRKELRRGRRDWR